MFTQGRLGYRGCIMCDNLVQKKHFLAMKSVIYDFSWSTLVAQCILAVTQFGPESNGCLKDRGERQQGTVTDAPLCPENTTTDWFL